MRTTRDERLTEMVIDFWNRNEKTLKRLFQGAVALEDAYTCGDLLTANAVIHGSGKYQLWEGGQPGEIPNIRVYNPDNYPTAIWLTEAGSGFKLPVALVDRSTRRLQPLF